MLSKKITYTDYFGTTRTETFNFNLTRSELTEMNYEVEGSLEQRMQKIVDAQSNPEIMKVFKSILRRAYGVISDDGRRFMKSEEISDAFEQSPAYDILFQEIINDEKASSDFIRSILPADVAAEINKNSKGNAKIIDVPNEAK